MFNFLYLFIYEIFENSCQSGGQLHTVDWKSKTNFLGEGGVKISRLKQLEDFKVLYCITVYILNICILVKSRMGWVQVGRG